MLTEIHVSSDQGGADSIVESSFVEDCILSCLDQGAARAEGQAEGEAQGHDEGATS